MNTYTNFGMEDAKDEMICMEELNAAKAEIEKAASEKPVNQKMFRQFDLVEKIILFNDYNE